MCEIKTKNMTENNYIEYGIIKEGMTPDEFEKMLETFRDKNGIVNSTYAVSRGDLVVGQRTPEDLEKWGINPNIKKT